MRTYKPLGKRVVVKVLPVEEQKTESGIVTQVGDGAIGDAFNKNVPKLRGIVDLIGLKVESVQKGDVIVFEAGAGVPLSILDPNVVWMEEEQIVAIEVEG